MDGVFCFPLYLSHMDIVITKQQYKKLVYTLLDNITGGELSIGEKNRDNHWYYLTNSYGEDLMSVFYKGKARSPGCKNDLSLEPEFVMDIITYIPLFKHKIFSEVLIDYVYDKTKIKCDCIDFTYVIYDADDTQELYGDEIRFAYNLKKKKRINID
jgi:hypothetical protein